MTKVVCRINQLTKWIIHSNMIYTYGFQWSTCGGFIPYHIPAKVFIYFALM